MAVALELAGLLGPPALPAVSWTLSFWPTSAAMGTYVWAVAPEMFVQLLPSCRIAATGR